MKTGAKRPFKILKRAVFKFMFVKSTNTGEVHS